MISRKRTLEDTRVDQIWQPESQQILSNDTYHKEKRFQTHKIHTEVHTKTIQMMMKAQLELQKQLKDNSQSTDIQCDHESQDSTADDSRMHSTYYQRPYW
ncbi:uncharacterized protein J8A68_001205 [[Candida] subhashii]|uniref:Uncharacterized protein n=1 Tax=[Candida] subhashii TaxID=561895 RepID=A0A8J5V4J6_9ASCO|nr:uncharacterized protein J8A68_001205 [[Candida] subhashii]KAG7665149.1 hypothetical protein J8A68_001205 [[Candida] subhashii]